MSGGMFSPCEVILFVDPSINTAGFCVYDEEPRIGSNEEAKKYKWHPTLFGCLQSEEGASTIDKCRTIGCLLKQIKKEKRVTHAYIEVPAEVVYMEDILKQPVERARALIMARASRVMKLFAAAHYYIGILTELGVTCKTILPVQWQTHKTQRKGRDTKQWSLDHANALLRSEGFRTVLKTEKDENTADAINMGYAVLILGRAGGHS